MNYSDLDSCIEEFLIREKRENIKSFKNEIEILYMLNNPEVIREVSYKLGDRGMPTNVHCRNSCHVSGLVQLVLKFAYEILSGGKYHGKHLADGQQTLPKPLYYLY